MIDHRVNDLLQNKSSTEPYSIKYPKIRLAQHGHYFKLNGDEKGLYSSNETNVKIDQELDVHPTDILQARLNLDKEEITLEKFNEILSTTIKGDETEKLITFLLCINAFSRKDHANIIFSGESSSGNAYIANEITKYFQFKVDNPVIKIT